MCTQQPYYVNIMFSSFDKARRVIPRGFPTSKLFTSTINNFLFSSSVEKINKTFEIHFFIFQHLLFPQRNTSQVHDHVLFTWKTVSCPTVSDTNSFSDIFVFSSTLTRLTGVWC